MPCPTPPAGHGNAVSLQRRTRQCRGPTDARVLFIIGIGS